MIDPLTAIALATQGAEICCTLAEHLKALTEATKNAQQDLLALLRRIEGFRNTLQLLRITLDELRQTEFKDMGLAVDDTKCQALLNELMQLATKVAGRRSSMSLKDRFQWARKATAAQELERRLAEQKAEIDHTLLMINTASSLRLQQRVDFLAAQTRADSRAEVAFAQLIINDDAVLQQKSEDIDNSPRTLKTWLGHVTTEHHAEHYLIWRNKLSDMCYHGDWSSVMNVLDTAREEYQEDWINAFRIKPPNEAHSISMWTPLHQAVYHYAPLEIVQNLIDRGASRLLRTRRGMYQHSNLTALELAHELKVVHLYDVLAPVVRNTIPRDSLQAIEQWFHAVIREDLGSRVDTEHMYLPVLEVLLELRSEPMWFPVKSIGEKVSGYLFQLDGREMIVKAINMNYEESTRTLRISSDGIEELEQAILLD